MSIEALEFEELIGDQLVTLGRSQAELLKQGPIELTIDGHKVAIPRVQAGYDAAGRLVPIRLTTIYDAAHKLYVDELKQKNPIPLLCHREHMTPVAVCRVCIVEEKKAPRLVPACQRPIEPKMEISTIATSPRVQAAVRTVTELLISDFRSAAGTSPAGVAGGYNELAELAQRLELSAPRFPKDERDRGQDNSSLVIAVDHGACILCDRCVRACNEIRHNEVIGRMGKGYGARIAFDLNDPMGQSSCVACGECMVSCPTGALSNRAIVQPKVDRKQDGQADLVDAGELADHPLFQGVSRPFLNWNRGAIVRRHFRKGETICREGEFGSTAFVMEKGKFEVRIKSPLSHLHKQKAGLFGLLGKFAAGLMPRDADPRDEEGDRRFIPVDAPVALDYSHPVAVLEPKDIIFGEMTCMSNYPRAATVIAAEDCTVLEILRNVLYILQRNKASKAILDEVYRQRTLESHLRSVKVFAELLKDEATLRKFIDFLRPHVQLVRVHPGQVIFRQGSPPDYFYLVRLGFVKVVQSRLGGEKVLDYVGPGGYFGEIALMSHLPQIRAQGNPGVRTATCIALDHVDLVRIPGEVFQDLLRHFPQVENQLVAVALDRLAKNQEVRVQLENVSLAEFLSQGLYNAQSLLVLDLDKCTRCDECTKACADAHDGVTRLIREGMRFENFLVASSCRSCLDPFCLVGCPVGSIRRRNSLEIIIEDWCIGCGKCAENCPYGNINMHGFATGETAPDPRNPQRMVPVVRQKATTCDLCTQVDGQPSCVYACPHDAAHRMSGKELEGLFQTVNPRRG